MLPFRSYQLWWKWWLCLHDACLVDGRWWLLAGVLPSVNPKSSAAIRMLPCAEVWLSPQHYPVRYCWSFQPMLFRTDASESGLVSTGSVPGKQSKGFSAKTAQIKLSSGFDVELWWMWNVNCRSWSWTDGLGEEPFRFAWGDSFK